MVKLLTDDAWGTLGTDVGTKWEHMRKAGTANLINIQREVGMGVQEMFMFSSLVLSSGAAPDLQSSDYSRVDGEYWGVFLFGLLAEQRSREGEDAVSGNTEVSTPTAEQPHQVVRWPWCHHSLGSRSSWHRPGERIHTGTLTDLQILWQNLLWLQSQMER